MLPDSFENRFREPKKTSKVHTIMKTSCVTIVLLLIGSGSAWSDEFGPVGKVRKLHGGFRFVEGPAVDANGDLYFSDIHTEKIYRLDIENRLTTFLEDSLRTNGLFFHHDGRMFACHSGSDLRDGTTVQISAYDLKTKQFEVIADSCDGKPFHRVNDLVIDAGGGVYFSDIGGSAKQPKPSGVFYCSPSGKVTQLVDDLRRCNGILLSPDEKTLYVLPSGHGELMAYAVERPGKIGARQVVCRLRQVPGKEPRGGDGLTVDEKGNLYLTCPAARLIQVVDPRGKTLCTIPFPEGPANCTFGGPDNKTLYVTARTSLYAVSMPLAGHRFGAGKK